MKLIYVLLLFLSLVSCKHTQLSSPTSIYGEDNRVDPFKHTNSNLKNLSQSIVLLTKDESKPIKKGGYCSGAIFSRGNQKLVLTAGHCLKSQQVCDESFFVLNYENDPQLDATNQLIYKCDKVLISKINPDFALATIGKLLYGELKTMRSASIELEFSDNQLGLPLAVIGHPEGGKKKISDDCKIDEVSGFKYAHRCDTFSGNSGSPMFELKNYKLT